MSCEAWYLTNPPTGANTVSVTVGGDTNALKFAASTFTNIDQTTPVDATSTATGSSGNPTIAVTTNTANDLFVIGLERYYTTNATTNRTPLYKDKTGYTLGAASYQLATTAGSYSYVDGFDRTIQTKE